MLKKRKLGQSLVEYLLLFGVTTMVAVVALAPNGFYTERVNDSLATAMDAVGCVPLSVCYETGGCPSVCGNGCCEPGEESTCVSDCTFTSPPTGPYCGDGVCNGSEACGTCSADCGACAPVCGDGFCNGVETCLDCALDCGICSTCGDSFCDGGIGEDSCTCPPDCPGVCGSPTCGDGFCNGGEVCGNSCSAGPPVCVLDCGACISSCGDGCCEAFNGENCVSCVGDCGACPAACGNNIVETGEICDGFDLNGEDCTTVTGSFDAGTLSCNGACSAFITTACTECGDATCDGTEGCGICPADCGVCPGCGDGNIDTGEQCDGADLGGATCLTAPGGFTSGTLACTASCTFDTSACTKCGNGICDSAAPDNETVVSCALDCSAIPNCGNGVCNTPEGETVANCPADCILFGGSCPDESCDIGAGESCLNCVTDCGICGDPCAAVNISVGGCAAQIAFPAGTDGQTIIAQNCPVGCTGTFDAICNDGAWGLGNIACGGEICGDAGTPDPSNYCSPFEDCWDGSNGCIECPVCVACPAIGLVGASCPGATPVPIPATPDGTNVTGNCPAPCTGIFLAECVGGYWDLSGCGEAYCGDNIRFVTEECDGTDLQGFAADCSDLINSEAARFTDGVLACFPSAGPNECLFDFAACCYCGNGKTDCTEVCDPGEFGGETCLTRGYDGGQLACSGDCTGFDESGCYDCDGLVLNNDTVTTIFTCDPAFQADCTLAGTRICDDTIFNGCDTGAPVGIEICDGLLLNGETCFTRGFTSGGTLACQGDCLAFDESGCYLCDGGSIDGPTTGRPDGIEVCDGALLDGEDCVTLGFLSGGTLACSGDCLTFDITGCFVCGNNNQQGFEICDGSDIPSSCVGEGFDEGTLACNVNCFSYNTSGCCSCGDGSMNCTEICDGATVPSTCVAQGFVGGGVLACNGTCSGYDTSGCFVCGNNTQEGLETCDGTDNPSTCVAQGFVGGGTLACNGTCTAFDTSGCFVCGNNTQEGLETCDGTDIPSNCVAQGFPFGGTLACNGACTAFDTSGCFVCGNNTQEGAEVCDGTDIPSNCVAEGFAGGGVLTCNGACTAYNTSACIP